MAIARHLPGGPRHGQRIDPMVGAEPAVLIGHEQLEEAGVHIPHLHRQPPAAIGRGEGAQQPALAIHRNGGAPGGGGDIQRPQRLPQPPEPQRPRGEAGRQRAKDPAGSHRRPLLIAPHQRRSITSSAPEAVRPKRWGRYMSSMVAGGRT